MRKAQRDIIAYVANLPESSLEALRSYGTEKGVTYRTMLIRDAKADAKPKKHGPDITVSVNFDNPDSIAKALLPYQDELLAISCRSEANIARFAKIIPHVPYLKTPSSESLRWATDKYEMRKRFRVFDPKITPKFTRVKDPSHEEQARVIAKVGFPMIIKPTNLAASLFVNVCYHEEDLERALSKCFRKIGKAYVNDRRIEEPKVIAEQFMDGDMYSIDSYVNSRGKIYHTPLVRVRTGKDIGHQDFYGYLQIAPASLKSDTIDRAEAVTETAIHALGLRSTTTHTELMRLDNEWKVIEVGPRMGGARDVLYEKSCNINHPLNDVLIRMGKRPILPKKCHGTTAFIKWFAAKEGTIIAMKGIKKIEQLESFYRIDVNKKVGDRSVFSRNGGRSVFNLYLYNPQRSRLLADIRRVEQLVKITVK